MKTTPEDFARRDAWRYYAALRAVVGIPGVWPGDPDGRTDIVRAIIATAAGVHIDRVSIEHSSTQDDPIEMLEPGPPSRVWRITITLDDGPVGNIVAINSTETPEARTALLLTVAEHAIYAATKYRRGEAES